MIAYYFRIKDDGPSGYIGLVFGANKIDLFWLIDEYCDPYQVEIKTAHFGGYCYHQTISDESVHNINFEFSEHEPLVDDDGWRKPNWDNLF